MTNFKYCPNCGQATLSWDKINKISCNNCGFVLYQNCAGAVAVLISCGEELLLTIRNQEPGKGLLDLPGGFTDPRETAEETCRRELYEELRLEINPVNLKYLGSRPNVYRYKDIDYNTLDLFFEYEMAEKSGFSLEVSEIADAVWLKKSNIKPEQLAFTSQKSFLKVYLGLKD